MSSTEPCLCGDPACARCFPWGQVILHCRDCGWSGRRYDAGSEELSDGVYDLCPACNSTNVVEEDRR